MNELTINKDLSNWFSTYGLITAQRLLERFKIKLPQEDLLVALKTPGTFYYQILLLPLQNVFNGIILQQAQDYQLYAQKLFIDYLVSGESTKDENAPGGSTREEIENERQKLVGLNDNFRQIEIKQENLIAESQTLLIKTADEWQKNINIIAKNINDYLLNQGNLIPLPNIIASITVLLVTYNFSNVMSTEKNTWGKVEKKLNISLSNELQQLFNDEIAKLMPIVTSIQQASKSFIEGAHDLTITLKQYRKTFKSFIIAITELMQLLPECPLDANQLIVNKQELHFDAELGGDS